MIDSIMTTTQNNVNFEVPMEMITFTDQTVSVSGNYQCTAFSEASFHFCYFSLFRNTYFIRDFQTDKC